MPAASAAACLGMLALLVNPARSQLDFGESLESHKCSFSNFQSRVHEVEAACCGDSAGGECQGGAAPTQCDISCAIVYAPFWAQCFDLLAMALGTGHRRHLQAAGGITPWETLANQCSSIDATRLLLAIKDLTDQGCYSASLANECEDGWILAASDVCFSAGGDAEGDDQYGAFTLPADTTALRLQHKSGGVSCNFASRQMLTSWGCDLGHEASMGTFVTTDCSTDCDMSHIVASPASRMLGATTWWYEPYDENWAEADELIFTEDQDRDHPQGDFHTGNYQLWYGEDLEQRGLGNNQADNAGTACVDVFYMGTPAPTTCIDVQMNGVGSSDTEYDVATLAPMAFDDNPGTWWDGCCDGYPNQNVAYSFNKPTLVNGYSIITGDGECPTAWGLEASDSADFTNPVVVDHRAAEGCHPGDVVEYLMEEAVTHQYYRFAFEGGEGGNSNGIRLHEIKFSFCSC